VFSATVQAAYSILGRGTHLLIDVERGRVVPGDSVRVALHGGDWVDVVVSEIDIVDLPVAGGSQPRCALLVPDLDPTEIVIGAHVTTAVEWDGNID
jgi:hypothetical protein